MSLGHHLIARANGQGRGDLSATFGLDLACRLVHRADMLRLPVNPVELKLARQLIAGHRRSAV